MKKRFLIFAGIAILSCIVSCQKSKTPGQSGADVIRVRLADKADTRAEVAEEVRADAGQELLFSIPVVTEEGDTLQVDAWISDMEDNVFSDIQECEVEPETRGVIRTTSNIAYDKNYFFTKVYTPSGSVYTDDQGASMANVTVQYVQNEWLLGTGTGDTFGEYCYYHWPADGSDIIFCSSYGTGASNINWNISEKKVSFNYVTPVSSDHLGDAAAQDDILFAMNQQNLNSRKKASDGRSYADIHFDHALTAVRFVRGNLENGTVQTVSMKGFYGAGNATANYTQGASVLEDKLTFTWNVTGDPMDFTQKFDRVLTDDDRHQDSSHQVTGAPLDPTANQEYTFFIIPQLLPDQATVEIYIKERIHPITVNLGGTKDGSQQPLDPKLRDWRTYAGKIITIAVNTVKQGDLIDIELNETVEANIKRNVSVYNTNDSKPVFVRVAIIANWVNSQGTIIYPYPIDSIFNDPQFTFNEGTANDWEFINGFYYYKKRLPINTSVKFINTFTAPAYTGENSQVDHLQMTIMVQGVECDRKTDLINTFGWPASVLNSAQ